jgi:hypothetical protein
VREVPVEGFSMIGIKSCIENASLQMRQEVGADYFSYSLPQRLSVPVSQLLTDAHEKIAVP